MTWQSSIGRAAGPTSLAFNGSSGRVRFAVVPAITALTVEAWVKRAADTGRYEREGSDTAPILAVPSIPIALPGASVRSQSAWLA